MAMYVKIEIGDQIVGVIGVQRQEDLRGHHKLNREYPYAAVMYEEDERGNYVKSGRVKLIQHRYSDGAFVLAEKVLSAFNENDHAENPSQ